MSCAVNPELHSPNPGPNTQASISQGKIRQSTGIRLQSMIVTLIQGN